MNQSDGSKLLISLSLPKTGTTYLSGLLEKMDFCSVGDIKEPTFFGKRVYTGGVTLKKVVANGNLDKGIEWYKAIFDRGEGISVLVDMSTQYWMCPEAVIDQAVVAGVGEPVFINIRREPQAQLISYLAHLRRGYIPPKGLALLSTLDSSFLDYLMKMSRWTETYSDLQKKYPNVQFVEVDFSELVKEPESVLGDILGEIGVEIKTCSYLGLEHADRNKMSAPLIGWLNHLVFSESLRNVGRKMPSSIYTRLIKLRKALVKANLKEGRSKYYDEDCCFIEKMISSS
ncbi:MAG: sulfotransferase [SAR324 cluster bacterium]|nr:sulfotransferase [SAR324 cluster bacterium]